MELRKISKNFTKFDLPLFAAILSLSIFSLLNLAGISGVESAFFKKQLIFFIIGIVVLLFGSLIDYRIFKNYSLPSTIFFITSILLLVMTLQAAPVRGVTAWLHLPFGISFETSELVKLAMILFLARYFSSRAHLNNISVILISGVYAFAAIFLVFSQPDFGSAIILFFIWLGGLFLLGLTKKQVLIAIIFLIIISLVLGTFILESYQKSRITSFLDSFSSQGRESYNVLQAKVAIGSGGLLGLGLGNGSQAKFGILPEATTDFALAALVEQFGFLALIIVLILYFLILSRLFYIAARARDSFSKFFIFMFLVYFFSHIVINFGMNLGLVPVTGLPLPFISYGGSFLISLMIGFSILENIRARSL
ncbi:MAG: rod shape determining protein RodA [Parcubacteria group bacterium Gr01-1014_2]|nr:MAG: rod shape determining protein RodA [Parcubacteria group bacterium Gr01-1014_2]